ncbi:MAG: hypothetical protein QOC72_2539 [Methylobacteriaceae bacterium]|jgi:hypothetical protein|nr:hypothetical protein [Methylobacteriaceae bacterium]
MPRPSIKIPLESLVFRSLVIATLLFICGVIIFRSPTPSIDHRRGEIGQHARETEKQEPSYADKLLDPISLFTLALVVSTVLLWRSTEKMAGLAATQASDMKESLAISKQAADAARLSAEAAIGVELPRIVFGSAEIMRGHAPSSGFKSRITGLRFEVIANNHGRTPAFLTDVSTHIHVGANLPAEPTRGRNDALNWPVVEIIKADAAFPIPIMERDKILVGQVREDVFRERLYIWVYGYLEYRDFLHAHHREPFVQRMELHGGSEGCSFFDAECLAPEAYKKRW